MTKSPPITGSNQWLSNYPHMADVIIIGSLNIIFYSFLVHQHPTLIKASCSRAVFSLRFLAVSTRNPKRTDNILRERRFPGSTTTTVPSVFLPPERAEQNRAHIQSHTSGRDTLPQMHTFSGDVAVRFIFVQSRGHRMRRLQQVCVCNCANFLFNWQRARCIFAVYRRATQSVVRFRSGQTGI